MPVTIALGSAQTLEIHPRASWLGESAASLVRLLRRNSCFLPHSAMPVPPSAGLPKAPECSEGRVFRLRGSQCWRKPRKIHAGSCPPFEHRTWRGAREKCPVWLFALRAYVFPVGWQMTPVCSFWCLVKQNNNTFWSTLDSKTGSHARKDNYLTNSSIAVLRKGNFGSIAAFTLEALRSATRCLTWTAEWGGWRGECGPRGRWMPCFLVAPRTSR